MTEITPNLTIEETEILLALHGIDAEVEITKTFQHEINSEIKIAEGWRNIQIPDYLEDAAKQWVKHNFIGKYFNLRGDWVIETVDDYTAFVLRFSE